jgi:HEAT repeat protein
MQVLRYLELTRDPNASRAAVESMRWLQPQQAEDRLCEIARGIPSRLRAQTARVLAAIGSRRCETELHTLLVDHNSEVRAQAAKALGALGRSDAVPALRAAFVDPSWPVRMEAARALLEMKEAGITAFLEELSDANLEGGESDAPVANGIAVQAQVA